MRVTEYASVTRRADVIGPWADVRPGRSAAPRWTHARLSAVVRRSATAGPLPPRASAPGRCGDAGADREVRDGAAGDDRFCHSRRGGGQ